MTRLLDAALYVLHPVTGHSPDPARQTRPRLPGSTARAMVSAQALKRAHHSAPQDQYDQGTTRPRSARCSCPASVPLPEDL